MEISEIYKEDNVIYVEIEGEHIFSLDQTEILALLKDEISTYYQGAPYV